MNGINTFIKRGLRELPGLFCHVREQQEVCNLEESPHLAS